MLSDLSHSGGVHLRGDIKLDIGQSSHTGPKDKNEDALGVRIPGEGLLATKGISAVISDGVSAASAAKEASESAVMSFLNDYYETPESWEVKTAGHRILCALNRWLFSQGLGHSSQEKGAVCTFTGFIFKSHSAYLFHIGDSRAYRLRDGELEQLSSDHTTKVSSGDSYLARALGLTLSPQIDFRKIDLEEGDVFLLSTDGIHEEITDSQISSHLSSNKNTQKIADSLAEASSHSKDNRSCLVLKVGNLPDTDKDTVFQRLAKLPFPPDLQPGSLLDGYTVERILTATRNTQLYLVADSESGRHFVMKTPSVSFSDDPSYLERFALEEWIGYRTEHINLVRAIKPSRGRTHCYYLLEHIQGITLTRWIEANPQAQLEDIVTIIGQVISGVRALHRNDTLHQDLKPDNILVLPDLSVKIIDYGSCHIGGISEIASPFERHSALGTIDFSAPEYRYGARPTTKSDLFSIAAVTYFLVTQQHHPFGALWEKGQTLRDFMTMPYISATRHNPMVPLWFDAALKKSLAATPASRHESMSEFYTNLKSPNYDLLSKDELPFIERSPILFWKLASAILLLILVVSHLLR